MSAFTVNVHIYSVNAPVNAYKRPFPPGKFWFSFLSVHSFMAFFGILDFFNMKMTIMYSLVYKIPFLKVQFSTSDMQLFYASPGILVFPDR